MKIKVCGYELEVTALNMLAPEGEEEDTKYFLNMIAVWLNELADNNEESYPAVAKYYNDESRKIHDRLAGLGFYRDVLSKED